jgi:hypothetical protein
MRSAIEHVKPVFTLGIAEEIWVPLNLLPRVPGSVRDNHGNKVNMVNNVPTTPAPVSGSPVLGGLTSVAPGASWNPVILTPFNDNLPTGSITVCPDGCPDLGGGGGGGSLTDLPVPN